jgi:hypothetical protein
MSQDDLQTVFERIDLPAQRLGFDPPPPCKVTLKFLYASERWTLYLQFNGGEAEAMKRWIQPYGPTNLTASEGLYPRVLRLEFPELPKQWEWVAADPENVLLSIVPAGVATVLVRKNRLTEKNLGEALEQRQSVPMKVQVKIQPRVHNPRNIQLTQKQKEVLSLAVSLGYYAVPHRIGLRGLASALGRSTGTISELLRRAESRIITQHVTEAMVDDWESDVPQMQAPLSRVKAKTPDQSVV